MPKEQRATKKFKDIKRQVRTTERELHRLKETQWSYVKNMLKFGLAAWVFGLSFFFLAIVMMNIKLFGEAPLLWTPLLVGVPAAPVTITAVSVRKFAVKIKRLERTRRDLLLKYQKTALRHMELKIVREGAELSEEDLLRKTDALKRQLRTTERELHRLADVKWLYVKKMLKFGLAAWIFGLSSFFFAIVMMNIELFGGPSPVWTSFLVGVPAAPVMITAVFVRKFAVKIKRLERTRRDLLAKYQKNRFRRMKRMTASKR